MSSETGGGFPLVSIVTSCYNRAQHVESSLRSLLDQTYPNFEVIVVNDGSTDSSGRILDAFDHPRLRIAHQKNAGNGMGLNAAIALSSGEYLAIHDFGDISSPERIARQAALLRARPEIGLVSCWMLRRDVDTGDVTHLRHRKTRPFVEAILRESPFSHGEVMYRRALFEQAGRYRQVFRYAVDRDLFIRMSRLCDYAVIEEVLYEQLLFPDGISTVPEKLILQAYFAELANQCGEGVLEGKPDLVDVYGHAAAFFVKPSARVANRIARLALKPLTLDQRTSALTMARAAWAAKATPMSAAVLALHWLVYFNTSSKALLLPMMAALRRRWTRRGVPQ